MEVVDVGKGIRVDGPDLVRQILDRIVAYAAGEDRHAELQAFHALVTTPTLAKGDLAPLADVAFREYGRWCHTKGEFLLGGLTLVRKTILNSAKLPKFVILEGSLIPHYGTCPCS